MSKTEFNSYQIKAILHVLKQFSDKKIVVLQKNMAGVKINFILSPFNSLCCFLFSACVYNKTVIPLTLSYMADSRLGANAPRRLSAHIRLEFVE